MNGLTSCILGMALSTALPLTHARAQPPSDESSPSRTDAATSEPTIRSVTMFRAGVGFFEATGTADDNGELEMRVATSDVNDLLKSLVVHGENGATVVGIDFDVKEPIDHLLAQLGIDVQDDPSLAGILRQVTGTRVRVDRLEGRVVGVIQRPPENDENEHGPASRREHLTLLTDDGLTSIDLGSVRSVRLRDDRAEADLDRALTALARRHGSRTRSVRLRLAEAGSEVRLGWVEKAPVWKITWRLSVPRDGAPRLQGWAIVENTSAQDWRDVELTLVSGRPISFVMELWEPIYLDRPEVELELYRGLRPRRHEQALGVTAGPEQAERKNARRRPGAPPESGRAALAEDFARSFRSRAEGEAAGPLFQHRITEPVTVPRHSSSTLPIADAAVNVERLSLFEASTHPEHPVHALRVENRSDLVLMHGPVTVFVDGGYSGEALLPDLPPGAERLLAYALDVQVEVARDTETRPREVRALRIVDGVLHATWRRVRDLSYTMRSSADEPRTVLVQVPRESGWEIESPEPVATTASRHRFRVVLEPEKSAKLEIRSAQRTREEIALTDVELDRVHLFLTAPDIGDEVGSALSKVVDERNRIARLESELESVKQDISAITDDQERIRENLAEIGKDTQLYGRYLDKLGRQEDRIETLRDQRSAVEKDLRTARRELREYLSGLDLGV